MKLEQRTAWGRYSHLRISAPEYTKVVFDPNRFRNLVKDVVKRVRWLRKKHPFDAIAACGHSGVPLASALSLKLGIPMILVRKESKKSRHDDRDANGYVNCNSYLIIDDLVDSGKTIARIINAVGIEAKKRQRQWVNNGYEASDFPVPKCVAVLLYDPNQTNWYRGAPEDGIMIPGYGVYDKDLALRDSRGNILNAREDEWKTPPPTQKALKAMSDDIAKKLDAGGEATTYAVQKTVDQALFDQEKSRWDWLRMPIFKPKKNVILMDLLPEPVPLGQLPDIDPDADIEHDPPIPMQDPTV